jgi:deoxyhypusine synthase
MSISQFMDLHFRHFNARETVAAARAWKSFVADGGQMLVTLAGAMSTAELGISLAKMIRAGYVHAICCTAANLEEDVFNLVANREYCVVPNWRELSVQDEVELRDRGFNRVTDTCIPETVIRHIEHRLLNYWQQASREGKSYFPYEYFFRLLDDPTFEAHYQVPKEHSWLLAAKEMGLAVYSPGYEDSTLGNIFAARAYEGKVSHSVVKSGTEQMEKLVRWYLEVQARAPIGFFQIGGGIAGDFAICAVPLIIQDLEQDVRYWSYFAQISDAVTSYGGYSGAVPNEKITWNKLGPESPRFMINSDASIVAPLIFAYVLGE